MHVLILENLKFDPKTDNPESFLVTLQTKALKAYPDPSLPAAAPIDGAAPDAAVEQTRIDSETTRRAEKFYSAQQARSAQIRRQFIKEYAGVASSEIFGTTRKYDGLKFLYIRSKTTCDL